MALKNNDDELSFRLKDGKPKGEFHFAFGLMVSLMVTFLIAVVFEKNRISRRHLFSYLVQTNNFFDIVNRSYAQIP